jgi:hypothetical protein
VPAVAVRQRGRVLGFRTRLKARVDCFTKKKVEPTVNVVTTFFDLKARVKGGSLESAKQRLNVHMAWNAKSEGYTLPFYRR